ncbi:MAG TPA: GNAT family N-acetyltransferase [Candidatus Aquilonibacter sp.]|nr:GNAT family N-acetyltransferase [Candidatus Aquilonibacter sp.]
MAETNLQFGIRVAQPGDVPALHGLIELSVRGLQTADYSPRQIEGALGTALGLDTQLILDGTYFVAFPADKPEVMAGCGGWSARRTLFGSDGGSGRDAALLDPLTEAARIRAIFVHPEYARLGLGSMILEHCESEARRAGFGRFAMGSTLTGVPLYRLRGYAELERVDVPLPNGEELRVVRMAKVAAEVPPEK